MIVFSAFSKCYCTTPTYARGSSKINAVSSESDNVTVSDNLGRSRAIHNISERCRQSNINM
jgi:hypothetical protein